jgi:hypothetical protein
MAHEIPRSIVPGTPRNIVDALDNDQANLDALEALMGRWSTLSQAWGENSGLGAGDPTLMLSGGSMSASDSNYPPFIFGVTATDLAVPEMTTQFRLVATMVCGVDEPDTTLTFGIHPFTGAGTTTFSPVVAAHYAAVAIANTAPSDVQSVVGAPFVPPADGAYGFGITVTGATVNTLDFSYTVELQYRHV